MIRILKEEKGSILIFTLWTVLLLSIFSMAVGYQVRQRLRFLQTFEIREKLRNIAEAGVKTAAYAIATRDQKEPDSLISGWANSSTAFREQKAGLGFFNVSYRRPGGKQLVYGIADENRKLNLKKLKSMEPLKRLITISGSLPRTAADDLAASIMDWRDEDEVLNAGGAESRYYRGLRKPYESKNSEIDTLQELMLVKGMTLETFAAVTPYLTLHGDGTININTASENVLRANGMSKGIAGAILVYRKGEDRITGTQDDRVIRTLASLPDQVGSVTGLSDAEKAALADFAESGRFKVRSQYFSVLSHAKLPGRRERLTMDCVLANDGKIVRCREYLHRHEGNDEEEAAEKKLFL